MEYTKQKRRGGTFSSSFFLLFLSFRRRLLLSSDSPSVSLSVLPPLSSPSFLHHINARKKKEIGRGEQASETVKKITIDREPGDTDTRSTRHRKQKRTKHNAPTQTNKNTHTHHTHLRRGPSRAHAHTQSCRQKRTHEDLLKT